MHPALLAPLLLLAACQQESPAQTSMPLRVVAAPADVRAEAVVLAGPDEPGERLSFTGRVLDYRGRPLSRAAVVAYHTDAAGLYNPPDSPTRVPRLRSVAITDEDGGFHFTTVRPGTYPSRSEPAHLHLVVTAPAHRTRYVDVWFEGDPLVTPERLQRPLLEDAETPVVRLAQGTGGAWTFHHDIRLEGN